MTRALLGAVVALLLAAAPAGAASASRVVFAAGMDGIAYSAAGARESGPDAQYWTAERDLHRYTPALWKLLHRLGTSVAIGLRYERDFGPRKAGTPRRTDVLRFVRAAARYRVPVSAWLTYPYGDGYWATEKNTALVAEAAEQFDRWTRRHRLRFHEVALDLEASLRDTEAIAGVRRRPDQTLVALADNLGPAGQCAAVAAYRRVTARLRTLGHRVTADAYPFAVDDALDGNAALSDLLDLPLVQQGMYAHVGFMTMRTIYQSAFGADPGPSLQLAYGADIQRLFGAGHGLNLGEVGAGAYADLDVLAYDVRAAAAAVHGQINVFALDDVLARWGTAGVERLVAAGAAPLTGDELRAAEQPSPGLLLARGVLRLLDTMVTAFAVPNPYTGC